MQDDVADIFIFILAEEGNSSSRNVHNDSFSQCQLFNSFYQIFLHHDCCVSSSFGEQSTEYLKVTFYL